MRDSIPDMTTLHTILSLAIVFGWCLNACLGGDSSPPSPPVQLFPLGETRGVYDVQNSLQQTSALTQSCPLLTEQGDGDHEKAFFFDGSARSVANITLSGREGKFIEKVSFIVTLKPDSVTGVIFEYRADDETQAGLVSRVKAELTQGPDNDEHTLVQVTLSGSDNARKTAHSSDFKWTDWKDLMIWIDLKGDKRFMKVKINDKDGFLDLLDDGLNGLAYPGKLHLGESWTGDSYFLGRVSCVAFYDRELDGDSSPCSEDAPYHISGLPDCPYTTDPPSYSEPRHLWPLTQASLGYDIMTLNYTTQPPDTTTCPDLHVEGEFDSYPSWSLDGSRDNEVQVRVSNELYSFTVSMYILTYTDDAVLFEYTADGAVDGEIAEFVVYIKGGLLRAEFKNQIEDIVANVSSSETVTEEWTWVTVAWDYGRRQITVIVNGEEARSNPATIRHRLAVPGKLTVGGASSVNLPANNMAQPYLGRVSCLAIYDQVLTEGDRNHYEHSCEEPWIHTPVVRECPLFDGKPLHVWPLSELSLGYDVMTLNYTLQPADKSTCPDLYEDGEFYPSWIMDGSPENQVQVRVSDELSSFSVALYIWTYTEDAVVLEYAADTGSVGGIAEFVIYLTGGYLRVEFRDHMKDRVANVTSEEKFEVKEWEWMALSWNSAIGQVILVVDDKETKRVVPTMVRNGLSTPGKLTLGGASSVHWPDKKVPEPYLGKVSCLAVYRQFLTKKDKGDYEDSCKESEWEERLAQVDPPCVLHDDEFYHSPIHLWPLTSRTMTYDIIGHVDGVTPNLNSSWGCPVFGPLEGDFNYDVMSLDENSPEVVLKLSSEAEVYTFTFGAIVEGNNFGGRLLEYTADDVSPHGDVIGHVTVDLKGPNLEVNMTTQDGRRAAYLKAAHDLESDAVNGILVSWDLANGVRIVVKQDVVDPSLPGTFLPLPLATPGKLRIGSTSPNNDEFYDGKIGCVSFFSGPFYKIKKLHNDYETTCKEVQIPDNLHFDPKTCGDEPTTITDPSTAASTATNTQETTSHVQQTTMDTNEEPTIITGPSTATPTATNTPETTSHLQQTTMVTNEEPTIITGPSTATPTATNTPETTSHLQQTTMDTTKEPTIITGPSTATPTATNTPETTSHLQQTTMDTTKEPTIIKGPSTAESTNTTDEVTPTYIWPLNNVTVGVGVMSGISPVLPLEATPCFRVDDSDTSLARPHLKFDGSLPSYLVVPVDDSVFAGNFTIVLFVKAEQPAEGVLLNYTSSDPSAQGLSRIQIAFDNESSLEVSLWSATDGVTSLCDHLVISNPFNDSTDWKKLVVKRKLSTEKLEVRVDGAALATARYNCSSGEGRGSLGRMTIGGRRDGGKGRAGAGFRGSLKCLRILESVFNIPWHYGTCEQFIDVIPQNAQECPLETNMREKGFRLVAKDSQPETSAHPPIRSVETLSVVACAKMCLRTVNCKSFVITAGQTSRKGCDMYDYVTHMNTVNSAGTNYYELKN